MQTRAPDLTSLTLIDRPYRTFREMIWFASASIPHTSAFPVIRVVCTLVACIITGMAFSTFSDSRTTFRSVSVNTTWLSFSKVLIASPLSPRLSNSWVSASVPHWLILPIRMTDATPMATPIIVRAVRSLFLPRF